MRARYYEPATGRFVSEDQSDEASHEYAYANNNPVTHSDADGNSAASDNFLGNLLIILGMFLLRNGTAPFRDFKNWVIRKVEMKLSVALASMMIDSSMAKLARSLLKCLHGHC